MRTWMVAGRRMASLAALSLLGACASTTPGPVLLTLPPMASADAPAATPAGSMPRLVVRRVGIPEYLVARRVRYRADAATLAEWPDTYWAERIEVGVSREFNAALRRQLPGWALCDASCGDQPASMSLQVDLVPMDFVRDARTVQARAHIVLTTLGMPPRALAEREAAYEVPASGDTAQAQAQAMSVLLQRVAADAAPLIRDARP